MESNHPKFARSELIHFSFPGFKNSWAGIKRIEFGKVKHCFHTKPYLAGHLTQLQNKTVHVE